MSEKRNSGECRLFWILVHLGPRRCVGPREIRLAPHLRGGEHKKRQSGERIVLALDVQVCDQDEPADDGLVPDAGFARTRAATPPPLLPPATSATSATQTPCASSSDDAPSAPPRHTVLPRVMQTIEAPTSMASPISPYSAMTLVYAHIVHTVSAFTPAANPVAAPPFMPRPSSSRPALAAPAHTALMMLPAP